MDRSVRIIWAAGFFDGEGSIGTPHRMYLAITIAQVARGPLDVFEDLYGGRIYAHHRANRRHSDAWRWSLTGHRAADALEEMLPYLLLKRREAEWAIELARIIPEFEGDGQQGRWDRKRLVSEEEKARRIELANLIRAEHRGERIPQRL